MTLSTPTLETVAAAVASLLPSRHPLTATAAADPSIPENLVAYVATTVGQHSTELILAVDDEVHQALAALDELTAEEALRPALEEAAARLGPGVLGPVEQRPAAEAFGDARVYLLETDGVPHAWFGLRDRPAPVQGRSAPLAPGALKVLYDVEMTLTAEIGRTRLPVRDVLGLVPGAVLELDRGAGSPADVMVNGRLVARGEIVVIDEDYAVRITEIVDGDEAIPT